MIHLKCGLSHWYLKHLCTITQTARLVTTKHWFDLAIQSVCSERAKLFIKILKVQYVLCPNKCCCCRGKKKKKKRQYHYLKWPWRNNTNAVLLYCHLRFGWLNLFQIYCWFILSPKHVFNTTKASLFKPTMLWLVKQGFSYSASYAPIRCYLVYFLMEQHTSANENKPVHLI